MSPVLRDALVLALLLPLVMLGGCDKNQQVNPTAAPDDDELRTALDEVLDWTFEHRAVDTERSGAWQILHGVLAYGNAFEVEHGGERVPAVEYVLEGGAIDGFVTEPGDDLGEGRRGLRAIMQPGTKRGQGHADQWLAVLAQSGLELDQPIVRDGQEFTMEDFVRQVQKDVFRNFEQEFSWTLIALTAYLPTSETWTDGDGREWSVADLVQIEAEHDVSDGACGGTHRLIGLAMALKKHTDSGGELEGPWALAKKRIKDGIDLAKENQNPDGSFSSEYLAVGGTTPLLDENLGATGHVLEFLTLALTKEQLEQPWVKRAAFRLCGFFNDTKKDDLDCGKIYHAAHGLVLYRDKVYGERTYPRATETQKETLQAQAR
jgi:hypothetical protein